MSVLGRSLAEARQLGTSFQESAYRAAGSVRAAGEYGVLAGAAARDGAVTGSGLNRTVSLQHHAEQLKHFVGLVFACVNRIAQRAARQRLMVARLARPGKKPKGRRVDKRFIPEYLRSHTQEMDILESHPLLDAIAQPNEIMTRWALMYVTTVSLELTGKAYWWTYQSDKKGKFKGRKVIWPVPAHWMKPKHSKDQLYETWECQPDGMLEAIPIPADQVTYFYYPDASNPLAACSPLQALARPVISDESIADAQRRSFSNGIWPGLAITIGRHPNAKTPGIVGERPALTKEQRAQMIQSVLAAYRGVSHFDHPIILDAIVEDVKKISNTNREMDFLNSGKYTMQRIYLGFGVNPIVMGEIENANRASAAVAEEGFCNNTINPKLQLKSEIITVSLLPQFDDSEGVIAYIEPARANDPETERADREQLAKYGALSINGMLADMGKPPIHGGDIAYITSSLTPVHVVSEDDKPPDGPAWKPGESEDNNSNPPPPAPGGFGAGDDPDAKPPKKPPKEDDKPPKNDDKTTLAKLIGRSGQIDLWVKSQSAGVRTIHKAMKLFFSSKGEQIKAELRAKLRHGRYSPSMLDDLFNRTEWEKAAKNAMRHPVRELAYEGAVREWHISIPRRAADVEAFKRGERVSSLPEAVRSAVDKQIEQIISKDWFKDLAQSVKEDVAAAMQTGLDRGESGPELADRVDVALGPDASEVRADRIARTEATGAINAGQNAAYEEMVSAGIANGREWVIVDDKDTRPDHADMQDVVAEGTEPFVVGGEECYYPGDDDLSAEQRCNCRCTTITVLADEPKEEEREAAAELVAVFANMRDFLKELCRE